MKGPHVEDMLSAYAAGELDPAERAACAAHLEACASCRAFLEDLKTLDALFADPPSASSEEELRRRAALLREAVADEPAPPRGEVWTPEEVAAFLKLPVAAVYEMAEELPFFSFAGVLRMRREALLAWMEEGERRRHLQGTASWVRRVG